MAISSALGIGSAAPGVCTSSTRPTSPFEGQIIFETDTHRVLIWDNAAWVMIADTDTPPALQLVKTQTIGTAVSSVTVTDAFSAEFENYKIIVSGGVSSTSTNMTLQLGSKTSGYRTGLLYHSWANTPFAVGSTTGANMVYAGNALTSGLYANLEVVSPFLSTNTFVTGQWQSPNDGGVSQMQTNDTVSYTSFTLATGSTTMTGGTIRVYGYRNS